MQMQTTFAGPGHSEPILDRIGEMKEQLWEGIDVKPIQCALTATTNTLCSYGVRLSSNYKQKQSFYLGNCPRGHLKVMNGGWGAQ